MLSGRSGRATPPNGSASSVAIIGGDPTGVELAGAVTELSRYTLARDVRSINPAGARINLVAAEQWPLSGFSEQGLIARAGPPLVVRTDEVSICSPIPPSPGRHGRCGAHYVGLDAHEIPWRYYGRPRHSPPHWREHRTALDELVGLVSPREASVGR